MNVSQHIIDDYEQRTVELEDKVNSLAADLLEERSQRHEVAEALVRVTEERDVAQAAYDSLLAASIEHTERHRAIFDEHLRQVAHLTDERDAAVADADRVDQLAEQWRAERDEARDEVVRLGRQNEKLTDEKNRLIEELHGQWLLVADFNKETERLRTIIGELGAAEAAEPEQQLTAEDYGRFFPERGDDGLPMDDTVDSEPDPDEAYRRAGFERIEPEEQIEALRPEADDAD